MAHAMGVDVATLRNNYSSIIEQYNAKGRAMIRALMFQSAQDGNFQAQKWLSQNLLGYKETQDVQISFPKPTIIVRPSGETVELGVQDIKVIEDDSTK